MSGFLYLCEMNEKIKKKDKEYYIGIGLCLGLVFGIAYTKIKKSSNLGS